MDNENIIRHRLLTGTSTTRGDPPAKKLAQALRAISRGDQQTEGQSQKLFAHLCSEIFNLEFSGRRHAGVQHACRKEVQRYVDKRAQIHRSTMAVEGEIQEAKLALEQAQVVRHHEEEYEVKKAGIMRQMGRPATAVEAASVREELTTIQAESVHLDSLLAVSASLLSPDLCHATAVALAACNALEPPLLEGVIPAERVLKPVLECVACVQLRRKQFATLLHGLDALQAAIATADLDSRD